MIARRKYWEQLTELWDLSETASMISEALLSLITLKAFILGEAMEDTTFIRELLRRVSRCHNFLEKLIQELHLYAQSKASESPLVSILIEALGTEDYEILHSTLEKALSSINTIKNVSELSELINIFTKKEKEIEALKSLLESLSETLTKKTGKLASELFTF